MSILVTGGAGFFGGMLKHALLDQGQEVVSVDLVEDTRSRDGLFNVQGDIRDQDGMRKLFREHKFETVYHCAAILAHAVKDKNFLWTSNVDGTRIVAEEARSAGTRALVFISSNCLWSKNFDEPVNEDEPTKPTEVYGHSKLEGEKILQGFANDLDVVTLRVPTIVDQGRLGLLAILFEFIEEGRRVWLVGPGNNKYQFLYAKDLINAVQKSAAMGRSDLFHLGSDNVSTLREVYAHVIEVAGTGARLASLPGWFALPAMRFAYWTKLSPLGPYQYKMIASTFMFDTTKAKKALEWEPTLTNKEMLAEAFHYYKENKAEIHNRKDVSAHNQAAKMGIIRILKWIS